MASVDNERGLLPEPGVNLAAGMAAARTGRPASADAAGAAASSREAPGAPADAAALPQGRSKQKKKTSTKTASRLTDIMQDASIGTEILDHPENIVDDVFAASSGPSGGSGSGVGAMNDADFPPEYNIIRTAKAAGLAPVRLGGLFGLGRVSSGARLGYGQGGLAVGGDSRTFAAQNYHCAEKGLNMSFSVTRPSLSGKDDLMCLACPVSHSLADRMAVEGRPVAIILADQNFPALLPAGGGDCVVIVRVEDGSLGELEAVFSERFRAFLKPHGKLTPGSVVLVGSLSHLRACGIQDYADSLVRTYVSMSAKVGAGVEVVPLVFVPMHGLESGSLIRNLMDLDAWLMSVHGGGRTVLPKSRETFWVTVTDGARSVLAPTESYTMMMPSGFRNHRKHPVVSDPYDGQIPTFIPPVSEETEKKIVTAILTELNDVYGLNLDVNPDVTRTPGPNTENGNGKTIFIGASHMARLSEAAQAAGADCRFVGAPGWVATKDSLGEAARQIRTLSLGDHDIVVIDLWANCAFMGTDENGLPCRARKGQGDPKYHVIGKMQAAPKTLFERVMGEARAIFESCGSAKVILVIPFPRYINGKCCHDPEHLSNWGQEGQTAEVYRAIESAESAIAADSAGMTFSTLSLIEVFNGSDLDLTEVTTPDGHSIWREADPVHLSQPAYSELADAVMAMHGEGGGGDRPRKRPRLESVVPTLPGGARGHQGRVRPPLWVSGMSARGRGGGGRPRYNWGPGAGRATRGIRGRGVWPPYGGYAYRGRGGGGGRGRGGRGPGYRF